MEESEKAFKELISYSVKLDEIEYKDIRDLIKESLRHIPITTAKLHKNTPIDRVRINGKIKFFNKEDDLTYIKNKSVIEKRLLEFGRANKPHEPLFYGALESSLIKQNRLTAFLETSTLLRDTKSVCLEGQLFTLARWVTNKELIIAEIVFSDDALKNNPDTLKSFNNHFEQIKMHPMREFGLQQLQFFSNEFSKEAKSHHDYKICVAYSDLLLNDYGIAGITYPSVQSGYQGQNLVLRPDIVDKHLKLYSVSTHRMHKNQMESFLGNYFHTQNFGKDNSNFVWDLKECDEENIIKYYSEKAKNAKSE
ncbi:hypothetical protein [Maribacter polysaccharolyticus]|uniref:hypothetical protein n=1 Tax=Maribacter polysaccharolyticus TaxID=3020831 RepID=UPI00237F9FCA|nr:hypothetical protein [Maribacter polysaccharolyticus]MDE3740533.1 hypothetical protein [Maribacter polysaccharolyticus]